jgi:galactose-6-phosphate isomerase
MPTLDVTRILTNPAFCDYTLSVQRNVQTVGENGLAVNTPTTTAFSGVVTPRGGKRLIRGSDAARMTGSIEISTMFVLDDGATGTDADIVSWQGRQYTVVDVQDWTTYGAGFVTAVCELIPLGGGAIPI